MYTNDKLQRSADELLFLIGATVLVAVLTLSFINPVQRIATDSADSTLELEDRRTEKRKIQTAPPVPPALQKDFVK